MKLGTPLADALQPAFKILVNTGYTDVITPDELNDCATGCGVGETPKTYADLGYTAYDRSFLTSGDYTTFLSQAPLTPQEWLQVPGDVVKALIGGFTDEIKKIFGGTTPPVGSVPSSVSASLRGSPAVQAISPATPSENQDPDPGRRRSPRRPATRPPGHDRAALTSQLADARSQQAPRLKRTARRQTTQATANRRERQPNHAAASRSAKSAA